jgi:hypothetical protein
MQMQTKIKRQLKKETLTQVSLVKNIVKAVANVSGYDVTYNQGYCAIKADEQSTLVMEK